MADLPFLGEFAWPASYLYTRELGIRRLGPWYFVEDEELKQLHEGVNRRYPRRLLVPFARRQDCDDVACLLQGSDRVLIVHDYASPGHEVDAEYDGFWTWFRQAVEEMIEWYELGASA